MAGQVSTTCNLILTVIFLRLFHHEPTPVPRKLRYLAFKIIAPMIFFDVKLDRNFENISQVVPNKETMTENDQKDEDKDCAVKQRERGDKDMYIKEWQTVVKVLDKLLFILNVISFVIAFGYGYTTLYTH